MYGSLCIELLCDGMPCRLRGKLASLNNVLVSVMCSLEINLLCFYFMCMDKAYQQCILLRLLHDFNSFNDTLAGQITVSY